MGELKIIFIVLVLVSAIFQAMLYFGKFKGNNGILISNAILGLIVSFMIFTSLPQNYTSQRIIGLAFGLSSIVALILYYSKRSIILSKVLLSISVIGGILYLFTGI